MNLVYLEQRGASGGVEHSKFYEISDDGRRVTFRWGKTGSSGETKVALESDDANARRECFDKQLKAKTKRKTAPYVVVERDGRRVEERPASTGRRWGLEVETHSRLSVVEVAKGMTDRGLKVALNTGSYFKSEGKVWDVKRDGSCGFEFASPIMSGESGLFDAKVAVEKIREVCPSAVNQACGIHVTIDVSDFSFDELKNLVLQYMRAQEYFYAECAAWRQDNRYCQRNPFCPEAVWKAQTLDSVIAAADGNNRYHGLNLARLKKMKIVEFRMLESSVSVRKVGSWINLCVGFVNGIKLGLVRPSLGPMAEEEEFKAIISPGVNH